MSGMVGGISSLASSASSLADSGLLMSPGQIMSTGIEYLHQNNMQRKAQEHEKEMLRLSQEYDRDLANKQFLRDDRQMGLESIGGLATIRNQARGWAQGRIFKKSLLGLM